MLTTSSPLIKMKMKTKPELQFQAAGGCVCGAAAAQPLVSPCTFQDSVCWWLCVVACCWLVFPVSLSGRRPGCRRSSGWLGHWECLMETKRNLDTCPPSNQSYCQLAGLPGLGAEPQRSSPPTDSLFWTFWRLEWPKKVNAHTKVSTLPNSRYKFKTVKYLLSL